MIEMSRELVAYGIIGAACAVGLPWMAYAARRRNREKLRRRGIKTHGH
jgi:type II secretory pathway pseudopilin PulG